VRLVTLGGPECTGTGIGSKSVKTDMLFKDRRDRRYEASQDPSSSPLTEAKRCKLPAEELLPTGVQRDVGVSQTLDVGDQLLTPLAVDARELNPHIPLLLIKGSSFRPSNLRPELGVSGSGEPAGTDHPVVLCSAPVD